MISVLVCVEEGAGVSLLEMIPLMCILIAHRGILFFSILSSSQGAPLGSCSGRWPTGGNIHCLPEWQAVLFVC